MEFFIGSKVQCIFYFEIYVPEGRGEKREGIVNLINKAHRTFDPRNNSTPIRIGCKNNWNKAVQPVIGWLVGILGISTLSFG